MYSINNCIFKRYIRKLIATLPRISIMRISSRELCPKFIVTKNRSPVPYQYCDSFCILDFKNGFMPIGFAPNLNQNCGSAWSMFFGAIGVKFSRACGLRIDLEGARSLGARYLLSGSNLRQPNVQQ